MGTHDFIATTASYLPETNVCVLNIERKEVAVQFCLGICIESAIFKTCGKVSPKRIKSMEAEGWKGKLEVTLENNSFSKHEKRLRFNFALAQIAFGPFFFQKYFGATVNPRRIKSMGAGGCSGKIGGDTWGKEIAVQFVWESACDSLF